MEEIDIRKEAGLPTICEKCLHKDVCYYLNEYGEATHCTYFIENKKKEEV